MSDSAGSTGPHAAKGGGHARGNAFEGSLFGTE